MSVSVRGEIVVRTLEATPKNKGLFGNLKEGSSLAAKREYLVRDTMKAVGHSRSFPKPVAALFLR